MTTGPVGKRWTVRRGIGSGRGGWIGQALGGCACGWGRWPREGARRRGRGWPARGCGDSGGVCPAIPRRRRARPRAARRRDSALRPAQRVVAGDAGRAVEPGELTVGILVGAAPPLYPVTTPRPSAPVQLPLPPAHPALTPSLP